MQIVIDIPDEVYKAYKLDFSLSFLNSDQQSFARGCLINGLLNGTPLPKGHGRLIDGDALNRKDVNCANTPMNFIDTAPTIIEADKEYKQ